MANRLRDRARDAVDHLLTHGLISPEAMFDADVRFVDLPGRNSVLAVRGLATPLIVKEYRATLSTAERLSVRESTFFELINGDTDGRLRDHLSHPIHFDDASGRLVLREETGHPALSRLGALRQDRRRFLEEAGMACATIHESDTSVSAFPPCIQLPFLRLNEERFSLATRTAKADTILAAAQAFLEETDWIDRATAEPAAICLVHADLRLSNLLVSADQPVRILDWETAGLGPASLDLGLLIGSTIYHAFVARLVRVPPIDQELADLADPLITGYGRIRTLPSMDAAMTTAAICVWQFAFEEAQRDGQVPSIEILSAISRCTVSLPLHNNESPTR